MTADHDVERDVTRLIGLLYLRHPDLIDRVSYDELRRLAAEALRLDRNRLEIPQAFRDAFR